MEEISHTYVQKYIEENQFDLLPTQQKISFPMIERYYRMLKKGERPLAIKIAGDTIVDGHHRYISGHIFGEIPEKSEWILPKANEVRKWNMVTVASEDFDNELNAR